MNWIQRAGFEKTAESVSAFKEKFVQRVPAFDNINVDFLSMTLETLAGVMFEGKVYKEDFVLGRKDYDTLQTMIAGKASHTNIANFIQKHRTVDKKSRMICSYSLLMIRMPSKPLHTHLLKIAILWRTARFCPGVPIRSFLETSK